MNIATVFHRLRWSLLRIEERLLQAAGLDRQLGKKNCSVLTIETSHAPDGETTTPISWLLSSDFISNLLKHLCVVPALAVSGPGFLSEPRNEEEVEEQPSGFLDSILWMAVPKKRRTIEVNRTRRRAKEKLIKILVQLLRFFVLGTITRLDNITVHQQQSVVFCCHFFSPTLSHVQSAAISNRNTSCVASVMLRFSKKPL